MRNRLTKFDYGKKDELPVRMCARCGKQIQPRHATDSKGRFRGWYLPSKYCSSSCSASERNKALALGNFIDKHGYVLLSKREDGRRYQQPEHRAVMEQMLGRKLEKHETVHHKNGVRHDNRPENLELWSGRHGKGQRLADLAFLQPDAAGFSAGLLSFSN